MPHKRAKKSVRDQQRADRKIDLPPTSEGYQSNDIPKSAVRVLNALKIREAFKEKKRKTEEDATARQNKKRKLDEDNPQSVGKTLKIKPGETLAHFNNRVEQTMRPAIESAYRLSRKSTTKTKTKEKDSNSDKQHQNPSLKRNDTATTNERFKDHPTEFAKTSSSAPKRLNDIVMAPPSLPILRVSKFSAVESRNASVVSSAQKRMMEIEREKAILKYRALKEAREKTREDGQLV